MSQKRIKTSHFGNPNYLGNTLFIYVKEPKWKKVLRRLAYSMLIIGILLLGYVYLIEWSSAR